MKGILSRIKSRIQNSLEGVRKLGAFALIAAAATTTSTSISGSSIFSGIWNLLMGIAKDVAQAFGNLISQVFSGFGQSVVAMFQSFGFSMSAYGVWGPVMFVVGIGAALFVGYLFLDAVDMEKDVTGLENDV